MTKRQQTTVLIMACAFAFVPSLIVQAQSTISTTSGAVVRGDITGMTAESVTVETRTGNREVQLGEIRTIKLDSEPVWLSNAKSRYRENRFETCYETLNGNKLEDGSDVVAQEIEFYKTMSAAQLAMTGGEVTANQAGTLLVDYINANPNSINVNHAIEMFADLASNTGAFNKAIEYYEKISSTEFAEMKVRVNLKLGQAKLYADDHAGALAIFEQVEKADTENDAKLIAKCYRVQAMAYQGQAEEGINVITELIKNESSDKKQLFARAYNALGCCHLNKGDHKAARNAFMHTQLLYFTEQEAYAEALFHLHQVSKRLQDSERSARTRQLLKSRYPNSHWASKL